MRKTGFTLLEMMAAVTIAAIILLGAAWALKTWRVNAEAHIMQLRTLQALQVAAQEALTRHAAVIWCPASDDRHCALQAAEGQLLFLDHFGDGKLHHVSQRLQIFSSLNHHGYLLWRAFPRYRNYIRFTAHPILQSDNGTIWYCAANQSSPFWAIFLNRAGHTRVVLPDANHEIRDPENKLLVCQ